MFMNKLHITIISRTILPTKAPRAFRATELAKALAKKGHYVTLMASLGEYDYTNFKSNTGVVVKDLGTPSIALRNSDGKLKVPLWKKGIIFIFMKLLNFPDILLIHKVKKAVKQQKEIDLLITIAIPHSIHWAVSFISKKNKNFTTWVSDCGDPFMGNTFAKPYFYFKYFEKYWCKKTDYISVPVASAKDSYYKEFIKKIVVIPQGFNLDEIKLNSYLGNNKPTFIYAGLFYPEKRDPTLFLKYLETLDQDFCFIVYTDKNDLLKPFLNTLQGKLVIKETISREQLLLEMSSMDFLINVKNKGTNNQVPSKLIDYSLSKRPILEISSSFTEDEKENLDCFLKGDYSKSVHIKDIHQYDAATVATQFLQLHTQHVKK